MEIVQRLYRALNAGDVAGLTKLAHPEAEWIPDSRTGEGPIRGRDNVVRFFLDWAQMFDEPCSEPERLLEADDKVLAFVRVRGRGAASGAAFDIRVAHLWSLRDGVVIRGEGFGDRREALQAVGLKE